MRAASTGAGASGATIFRTPQMTSLTLTTATVKARVNTSPEQCHRGVGGGHGGDQRVEHAQGKHREDRDVDLGFTASAAVERPLAGVGSRSAGLATTGRNLRPTPGVVRVVPELPPEPRPTRRSRWNHCHQRDHCSAHRIALPRLPPAAGVGGVSGVNSVIAVRRHCPPSASGVHCRGSGRPSGVIGPAESEVSRTIGTSRHREMIEVDRRRLISVSIRVPCRSRGPSEVSGSYPGKAADVSEREESPTRPASPHNQCRGRPNQHRSRHRSRHRGVLRCPLPRSPPVPQVPRAPQTPARSPWTPGSWRRRGHGASGC